MSLVKSSGTKPELRLEELLRRIGTRHLSQTGQGAQFWTLANPSSAAFDPKRLGIPSQNTKKIDFVEVAVLRPGTPFVTRTAPAAAGQRGGGALEVVVEEGGVIVRSFEGWEP